MLPCIINPMAAVSIYMNPVSLKEVLRIIFVPLKAINKNTLPHMAGYVWFSLNDYR